MSEDWGAINSGIQQTIQQVINNQYTGALQDMFLLSKSIELLVLTTDNVEKNKLAVTLIKKPADKEKIIAARDIINQRLNNPPNLSEIAKMVGLNEYKLKHGFKEIFHSTLFDYMTAGRLETARLLLLDTSKSAAEIAYEMGYATPQHFNNAFRKKFGITPNSVRKTPKKALN